MGGNLGETGCVNFMFDRMAEVVFPAEKATADEMFEAALEAGAANVESGEEYHEIYCDADDFAAVRDALEKQFGEPVRQGLIWKPNVTSEADEDQASSVFKLIDLLEDNDDVQKVTTNIEVSDDVMEKLAANG